MFRFVPLHASLPLFVRILILALGGILCAQAITFSAVLLVRLPQPQTYLVEDIAQTLRSGEDRTGTMSVSIGRPPSESEQDNRDVAIRASLARLLEVDPTILRLVVSRPPMLFDRAKGEGDSRPKADVDAHKLHLDTADRSELIIGNFSGALRLPDGQWRVVKAAGGFIEPWQGQMLLWLFGAFAVAVPLAWTMSRRVAEPVRLFAAAAERLGRDPSMPLLMTIDGPPEIKIAMVAFNDMQARLKQYVDDRTAMTAAIAHDLRTPLMRLMLLLDAGPPEIRASAEREIQEMKQRIANTLAFVRNVNAPIRRQKVDLRTLVESVADGMVDQGADVEVAPGEDIVIEADVAALRSLIANLSDNAVKYGGKARLRLSQSADWAQLEVSDDGPGISPEEFDNVFKPFYRLDASRNRDTGGSGLGLASVKAVVQSHGGRVTLANRPEGGLLVSVALPLSEANYKRTA